jgi:hypothetical protein
MKHLKLVTLILLATTAISLSAHAACNEYGGTYQLTSQRPGNVHETHGSVAIKLTSDTSKGCVYLIRSQPGSPMISGDQTLILFKSDSGAITEYSVWVGNNLIRGKFIKDSFDGSQFTFGVPRLCNAALVGAENCGNAVSFNRLSTGIMTGGPI